MVHRRTGSPLAHRLLDLIQLMKLRVQSLQKPLTDISNNRGRRQTEAELSVQEPPGLVVVTITRWKPSSALSATQDVPELSELHAFRTCNTRMGETQPLSVLFFIPHVSSLAVRLWGVCQGP